MRLLTGLKLFFLALRLTLWPDVLSSDYGHAELLPERALSPEVAAGAAALVALVALAWWARRRAPDAARGIVIFVAGFAVVSNTALLLPTIFAERLLYLPAAGLALALAAGIRALEARSRPVALALAVALAGGNLARGIVRDGDWKDELALYGAEVARGTRAARALYNYGGAIRRAKGDPAEAAAVLAQAIAISPAWAKPRTAAGAALDELNEPALAEVQLRRAFELDPDDPEVVFNYALFLARRGRPDEAAAVLAPFAQRHPEAANIRRLLDDVSRRR